jgi:mono/diheme cytochrome c family protein
VKAWNASSRLEYTARIATGGLLLGLVTALVWAMLAHIRPSAQVIDLVARQPAAGGWSRDRIVVSQGQRVRLRIRSEDVVHGFAIARLGVDAGRIEPGKTATVEFVADQSGEFTFYCTTWCDPNHPRMRGIIEVRDAGKVASTRPVPAQDVTLHDLDMRREAPTIPLALPSAARGQGLYAERCAACHGVRGEETGRAKTIARRETLEERSPAQVYAMLADEKRPQHSPPAAPAALTPALAGPPGSHAAYARGWDEQARWDTVAFLWSLRAPPERLELGRRLFATNCAACHGERGEGDGPGGTRQPKKPANFTDVRRMLAGSSGLYTAKIRRGGMGTGMPYWGSIFSEDELAALVDYLWTFSLDTRR